MEGYANVNSNHEDYDDLNIEGRSTSDEWKNKEEAKPTTLQPQVEALRDLERRVLSLRVPLEDGSGEGYVFSFKHVAGVQRWRCHLCDVLVVGSRHVDTHIQSKKHQVKLALPGHPHSIFTRIEPHGNGDRAPVEVPALAPGEPVPPGFEDVVRRVAQIQVTLDAHRSSPLIGLEYMVELTPEERGKEPMYVCMLCDKKGDPRVAMAHMTSFNHRSKYIGIHFPTVSKMLATEFQSRKDCKKVIHLALNHVCSKIEERFGRLQPSVVERDIFEVQRNQIKAQIEKDPHFSESPGDTLVELLDPAVIDALIEEEAKAEAEPPKQEPSSTGTVFNRGKITCDRSRLRGRTEDDSALEEENVFKKLAEMEKAANEAMQKENANSGSQETIVLTEATTRTLDHTVEVSTPLGNCLQRSQDSIDCSVENVMPGNISQSLKNPAWKSFLLTEEVTKAEIIWCLCMIKNHLSIRSSASCVSIFQMFMSSCLLTAKLLKKCNCKGPKLPIV